MVCTCLLKLYERMVCIITLDQINDKLEMLGKAQRLARPARTRLQNFTEIKFAKFLSDVEGSLSVLTHASMLRSSNALWHRRDFKGT